MIACSKVIQKCVINLEDLSDTLNLFLKRAVINLQINFEDDITPMG